MGEDVSSREPTPEEGLRIVLERFDVGVVVRRMMLGYRQLPAYTRFDLLRDHTPWVRWNVDLLLRWMMHGTPPDEYVLSELREFVRDRAAASLPIEEGIFVYRRGTRMLWDALVDLSSDVDRSLLTANADSLWSYLDRYLDIVVDTFALVYADQEDMPSTAGDRRAGALFDRLCAAGLPITIEDTDRAARLGFDLSLPFCPFTAELVGGSVAHHAALAARLRGTAALAFTEGVRVTGLTPPAFAWEGFLADRRLVLAQDPPTPRNRLGSAVDSLRSLSLLATESRRRGRVSAEDFGPQLLLADSPALAERITKRVLGPLTGAGTADLATTLRSLAAHGFDASATAAAIPVHRNTLLHRVKRIEKLTGLNLREQQDRSLVLLAVMWETSPVRRRLASS
ncbi:PucR-like helix-turn-helix protein [Kribbella steppae]|uniref:PucR-like helix-turn-helix protein n=1 Tax=Kribbella steppae TaxID=2512223 RepID=A0A4R2H4P5_9ACTN|nr:PucR family transcriptional regulator [Kribbella steppae]TCO19735.1 PucR-like helix-turn-helix protein [Kribbella steppae]